jgi:hypothetical protein
MRLKHALALIVGLLLAVPNGGTPVLAQAADKGEQVKVAYENARKLYRQGKYQEAIKAFDEVKDLQYHPILDYGLANCYEALRDYNKAVYYLDKYLRNYPKFQMSPKHPSKEDVAEKIKALKERAAAPAGSGDPTPPTPPRDATPGGQTGDPVPGPDPYAVPPPPGDGAVGGGGAPPPGSGPPAGPPAAFARRSLMFSVDAGVAAFAGYSDGSGLSDTSTGGGLFASAIWRFVLGIGVSGGFVAVGSDATDGGPAVLALGALEVRGFLPVGRLDFWGSVGIGYGVIASDDGMNTYSASGPALTVAAGMDWFIARSLSIGVLGRVYRIFPTKFCVEGSGMDSCSTSDLGDYNPGVAWYLGVSATYYLPLGRR